MKKKEKRQAHVWRSFLEQQDEKAFSPALRREFVPQSVFLDSAQERGLTRRSFLKIMGASTALGAAGISGCRRPEEYLVPYTEAPEWVVPGKALYYATTMPFGKSAHPLIVTTYEGRPTKLETNQSHQEANGVNVFAQASILDLYDSHRSQKFLKRGEVSTYEDFEKELKIIGNSLEKGEKVGFVFGDDFSPTRRRLLDKISARYPQVFFSTYEPLSDERRYEVWKEIFERDVSITVDFSRTKRILSFDADFLGLDNQGNPKGFYALRQGGGKDYKKEINPHEMNRLYMVEGNYSLTGGMADHRLRISPHRIFELAIEMARELQELTRSAALNQALSGLPSSEFAKKEKEWIRACANDLYWHRGNSAILTGSLSHKGFQRLVVAMNVALDNYGREGSFVVSESPKRFNSFASFVEKLKKKELDTVFFFTPADPVFDVPMDVNLKDLLSSVKRVVHCGLRKNATALAADWHIPASHYLENWGDVRSEMGVYSVIQPLILPLFGGISDLDILCALLNDDFTLSPLRDEKKPSQAFKEIQETVRILFPNKSWNAILKKGFAEKSSYPKVFSAPSNHLSFRREEIETLFLERNKKEEYELQFLPDASVFDGRFIENSWLQEAPDPVSKLTWDNAALISPKTAKKMGIYEEILTLESKTVAVSPDGEAGNREAPMIEIQLGERSLKIATLVSFGLADDLIVLPLGYGQGEAKNRGIAGVAGPVGKGTGFDTFSLRNSTNPFLVSGAKVKILPERYPIALTQEHHALYGRALAREISTGEDFDEMLEGVRKQGIDSHAPENISLYKSQGSRVWHSPEKAENLLSDPLHQWAMSIDLNVCIGCNACLMACQAENNIPVVGKEQVAKGREMHWIRMDRYFSLDSQNDFDEDNPEMIPQPVACLQCENAPCESVCPVNATVHTDEGLNAMAYNRCIGTRYCANNCPYKARRFNFFDYNKRNPLVKKNLYKGPFGKKKEKEFSSLQKNPNVTVRTRGVMEKCTYCVQRLQRAKINQKTRQVQKIYETNSSSVSVEISKEDLRVPKGSVKVACQEACPAEAIRFGNLLDEEKDEMVRAKNSLRNYDLLSYLGTRPRTSYLARVKNPNLEMPDASFIGKATVNMH